MSSMHVSIFDNVLKQIQYTYVLTGDDMTHILEQMHELSTKDNSFIDYKSLYHVAKDEHDNSPEQAVWDTYPMHWLDIRLLKVLP